MVYDLCSQGYDLEIISFDYGQRHKKELVFARAMASQLGLRFDVVDLSGLAKLISNSALTSAMTSDGPDAQARQEIEVPEGHYAEDNMKLTVVPNRNMIMLSIAAGVAVNRGFDGIATAVHAGDHVVYPDCRPHFIAAANGAVVLGNEGFGPIPEQNEGTLLMKYIKAPYLHHSKMDIAYRAFVLGVPLHMTWSCYKGGENHCGRCGTCVERLEAINGAYDIICTEYDVTSARRPLICDLTVYDDTEYWKVVVAEAQRQDIAQRELNN
jgi:7-cyano-7-deazaguanine synthase